MKKEKKKPTTSEPKRKAGRPVGSFRTLIPGTKEIFKREYPSQDARKEVHPEEVEDFEEVAPTPNDEAASSKFPPPKKHAVYRQKWMQFIDSIARRENFTTGHLNNLDILCDLYVEYELLNTFLRKKGRSYLVYGRQGKQWKLYPEVSMLNTVKVQIITYTRLLGLVLKKDHDSESGGEKDNWE